MTAPDKAFEEWWETQEGANIADPKEMLDAMIEAFRDIAKLGYEAAWLASRKAALEDAANTANMVGAIGNPSSEGTQRVDIMAKQISLAILALGDK